MGDSKGFLKNDRKDFSKQPARERVKHWKEFSLSLPEKDLKLQAARCMDCGVPFCHWGCPIANIIPDWNDLVYRGAWAEALERLHKTNNFPEFTGRICPAPCEHSCTLAINKPAVTIKNIEVAIIEKAYASGGVAPQPPKVRSGKTVAVVGAGPAGLACADQLNKMGHKVTVYEKNEEVGGLLTFGIPDYKLEKSVVRRRVERMEKEGVSFKMGVHVGVSMRAKELSQKYDAVVLSGGAEAARDLQVSGRDLKGIYQAMEYLPQQNRVNRGAKIDATKRISAEGKHVVVLGGGDTGSDCIGTAHRQGAKSVRQFEIMPRLPDERAADNPWPWWGFTDKKSTSHEEGVEQEFCVMTKELIGEDGVLKKLKVVRLEYGPKDPKTGRRPFQEIPGSEFVVDCGLLLLAMGFLGPVKKGMIEELGLELDPRGNVKTNADYMTSVEGVFAAGDMRRGQSLVVWAINEGRCCAEGVNRWLASTPAVKK